MNRLSLKNITKRFQPKHPLIIDNVGLELENGQIAALLGPSGCGKTTLLRLIAGLDQIDSGEIYVDGELLSGMKRFVPPEKRRIGMVFQDYALFPHLSVFQNVIFGLNGPEKKEKALKTLDMVGLTVFKDRLPHQLSGGQQQRVALARTLAPEPRLILLDEPFSNLDASLRVNTRREVKRILRDIGATALLVTHDQEEALSFADHLIVMREGHIEQEGKPEEVYRKPRTAFVANFLGQTNLISGFAENGIAKTIFGDISIDKVINGPVLLSIRPEDLSFAEEGINAIIINREFKGHDITFAVKTGDQELIVQSDHHCLAQIGDQIRIKLTGLANIVNFK